MKSFNVSKNNRVTFTHIQELLEIPDLLAIQTRAYQQFLQEYEAPEARKDLAEGATAGIVRKVLAADRISVLKTTLENLFGLGGDSGGGEGESVGSVSSNLSITVESTTRSIIVRGYQKDLDIVDAVVKEIDVRTKQVLINGKS